MLRPPDAKNGAAPGVDETGFVEVCQVCGQQPGRCADPPEPGPAPGPAPGRHRASRRDGADPLPEEPWSELGYARRLIKVYGDRLRYVPAWESAAGWSGTANGGRRTRPASPPA